MPHLIIGIFSNNQESFEQCKKNIQFPFPHSIYFCDSQKVNRLSFLKNNLNSWVLFIDSDCHLIDSTKEELVIFLTQDGHKKNLILSGKYKNPNASFYLQRTHNFIANTWVNFYHRLEKSEAQLLGGIFLIFTHEKIIAGLDNKICFWGSEDKYLGYQLKSAGYNIAFQPKFCAIHETSKQWGHFLRRAFLHGFNDHHTEKLKLMQVFTKIKFWLFELQNEDFLLAPAVLLHFLILGLGKLFQKILRMNK